MPARSRPRPPAAAVPRQPAAQSAAAGRRRRRQLCRQAGRAGPGLRRRPADHGSGAHRAARNARRAAAVDGRCPRVDRVTSTASDGSRTCGSMRTRRPPAVSSLRFDLVPLHSVRGRGVHRHARPRPRAAAAHHCRPLRRPAAGRPGGGCRAHARGALPRITATLRASVRVAPDRSTDPARTVLTFEIAAGPQARIAERDDRGRSADAARRRWSASLALPAAHPTSRRSCSAARRVHPEAAQAGLLRSERHAARGRSPKTGRRST